ncbi:hypothetical protein A2962_03010 [Candidatus Woesebacteria bacterium RIFCSPLOWO2_01_FULL_39_61]|uniref:IMP dehydrogenase/GMP reductase domain-containing protein n=1 Tax=Candidatus Woesebacteria bacterium RIFCSPHIGHO2_02_FULL_39_13 TaxID=1802505 RepID=A0A1F7Z083_9BACT|nr:MAG: hypothetical protein A2692_04140 [Candidatus Woesebacteria bacterium RIFCSPHIGHO2_01_FULL_39_95]OGM33023.1 MAG: hypothetical protein A3D01_04220 [Candidatus Woesebacteria bacterium RIFCSPHIGHO2_02_FULL_39_13]OGM37882.1 MAG: hypothetical protein A3E13_04115 [Candidatus Woesebacteria bacterium RIFCSPHIGHO2_12_FULL_40_20]OGM66455.1 MAG: hypothetical protein A2962_03010 [Candidatus Woesebacteria bacterium RIFCSPLOWO2_01_FULL_39_61]
MNQDINSKKVNKVFMPGPKKDKAFPVFELREPYEEEMKRIRFEEFSQRAIQFAYMLECLSTDQNRSQNLKVDKFTPIYKEENMFYKRYKLGKNSSSIGVILTNIDLNKLKKEDKLPTFWQMGPERIRLALAQRALYFDQNQNDKIYKIIDEIESKKIKIRQRSNRRSVTVDQALGIKNPDSPATKTPAISELGYKKMSSDRILSRREILENGLFNKVGKYPRKILGLGAMPPVTGWRDTLVMAGVGHMLSFIPRSSIFASDLKKRVRLASEARKVIYELPISSNRKSKIYRNIGAALGAENPKEEVKVAKAFFKEAGISSFRIYTIGSDRRVIDTALELRQTFGDKIEIFVGQIADKKQAVKLIDSDIKADGLIYGHGGGQQCTSAINGMAITTLEDISEVTLDKKFNQTSIIVEGGIGRSIGTALILGIDCCLGNQKFVRGTLETGNLFVEDKKGKICQPYPGTASPVTQIIESQNPYLRQRRADAAGRTYYSEGKPGLMYYEEKACSMAFWINEYLRHASRTLADMGVTNISELRNLLKTENYEFLRVLTKKTQYLSEAHWNM